MGPYLGTPNKEKHSEDGENAQIRWGACSMQGWRKEQEDSHIAQLDLEENLHLFGVFDGHGGDLVALYAREYLTQRLVALEEFKAKNYEEALRVLYKNFDDEIRSKDAADRLKAVRAKNGSQETGEPDCTNVGCTAVMILMTADKIICANAGDSRAILSRKNNVVELSHDHKPQNAAEKKRIEDAGGYVENDRVDGALALSRSLGDFEYKSNPDKDFKGQKVTCDPDFITIDRNPEEDEFIVIACDGIWDCLSNEECVKMMKRHMASRGIDDTTSVNVEEMFDKIVATDIPSSQGIGTDNMTCILINFKKMK